MRIRRFKRQMGLAFAAFCLSLFLNGNANAKDVQWSVIAGPEGSFGYATTTILAKMLSDNIDNFRAFAEAGGTIKGVRQISDRRMMMTYGTTAAIEQAYLNKGPFEKVPLKGIKPEIGLPILTMTFFMVAKKSSDIHTMSDLVGKRVTITSPSYGIYPPAYEVFKVLGLWDKVKVRDVSFADYSGALVGGMVDAAMVYIISDCTTSGAIRDLEARLDLRAVTFTNEQKQKIAKVPGLGYREAVNIFPELETKMVGGWNFYNGWFFSPEADDDLVYKILKTCYEKKGELAKASIGFGPWDANPGQLLKDALSVSPHIARHPGAIRYFKEMGIK
jgi:TRAP transporter TAXI family solute receptor